MCNILFIIGILYLLNSYDLGSYLKIKGGKSENYNINNYYIGYFLIKILLI